jgi:hypothetical protein
MVRDTTGALVALSDQASAWSPPQSVTAPADARFRAFFNRGFLISQFMARYLAENRLTPQEFKQGIDSKDEEAIRPFLSGGLRTALLDQLRTVAGGTDEIYAALYELSDNELIDALTTLGPHAHLVLSNGSVDAKGKSAAEARQEDENADARAKLLAASVDVHRPGSSWLSRSRRPGARRRCRCGPGTCCVPTRPGRRLLHRREHRHPRVHGGDDMTHTTKSPSSVTTDPDLAAAQTVSPDRLISR